MMIKKILNVAMLVSFIWGLQSASCKKTDDKHTECVNNTMSLPQMAKDYFLFKDGTYWVYENVSTKELDSFYISGFTDRTGDNTQFKDGKQLNRCHEFYDFSMNGNLIGKITAVLYPFEPDNGKPFERQTFFIDEYNNKVTSQSFSKFTFIGDSLLRTDVVLESAISLADSLEVNGRFYYHIICQTNANLGIDYARQSYYAKHIGLIQFTTNDNKTWVLKRYHIVQ